MEKLYKAIAWGLVVLVGACIVAVLYLESSQKETMGKIEKDRMKRNAERAATVNTSAPALEYDPARVKTIQFKDYKMLAVGVDPWVYEDYANKSAAGDIAGANKLVSTGQVFEIASGTKILEIESVGGKYSKIKILEGPHQGKYAWTHLMWVRSDTK